MYALKDPFGEVASRDALPLVLTDSRLVQTERYANLENIRPVFQGRGMVVKSSPDKRFRYFDQAKNMGSFSFRPPHEEVLEWEYNLKMKSKIKDFRKRRLKISRAKIKSDLFGNEIHWILEMI